jgi:3-oxoacyl-[acyl-carrier-protein] synthase II
MSADAYHITAPHPDGLGAKNVMLNCLRDAGLNQLMLTGNMHGTSNPWRFSRKQLNMPHATMT